MWSNSIESYYVWCIELEWHIWKNIAFFMTLVTCITLCCWNYIPKKYQDGHLKVMVQKRLEILIRYYTFF